MRGKLKQQTGFYARSINILNSTSFLYGILVLAFLQGLWYIASVRAIIFDEGRHFGFTQAYSYHISPFFTSQPDSLNSLGSVVRDPSYLFYYLMSWPLRFAQLISDNFAFQLTMLRLTSLALFIGALITFYKVFREAGVPKSVIHVSLLFLVLTPSIAPLAGAFNYDNAIFLIAGIMLLYAARLIRDKKPSFEMFSYLLILGMLGSLMQFKLIAFVVPVVFYVFYDLWRRHSRKLPGVINKSFFATGLKLRIGLVIVLVVSAGLFIERPVYNIVKYHTVNPACTNFATEQACKQNYIEYRNITVLAAKPDSFTPVNPFNYVLIYWVPGMIITTSGLSPWGASVVLRMVYYVATLGGVILVLVYWRYFWRNTSYRLFLITTLGYCILLGQYLYSSYVHFGQPLAISGRYLLPVMPLFLIFATLSLAKLFYNHKSSLIVMGMLLLFVFATNGGGITTPIKGAPSEVYWNNHLTVTLNRHAADLLRKIP